MGLCLMLVSSIGLINTSSYCFVEGRKYSAEHLSPDKIEINGFMFSREITSGILDSTIILGYSFCC